jgi:hypothetical protein
MWLRRGTPVEPQSTEVPLGSPWTTSRLPSPNAPLSANIPRTPIKLLGSTGLLGRITDHLSDPNPGFRIRTPPDRRMKTWGKRASLSPRAGPLPPARMPQRRHLLPSRVPGRASRARRGLASSAARLPPARPPTALGGRAAPVRRAAPASSAQPAAPRHPSPPPAGSAEHCTHIRGWVLL